MVVDTAAAARLSVEHETRYDYDHPVEQAQLRDLGADQRTPSRVAGGELLVRQVSVLREVLLHREHFGPLGAKS